MSDLEPASALSERIETDCVEDYGAESGQGSCCGFRRVLAEQLIESDRAAVREPLEKRNRELETLVCDEREVILQQRERIALLETDLARAQEYQRSGWDWIDQLETALGKVEEESHADFVRRLLEERMRWRGERDLARMERDDAKARISSLEAQLASARSGLEALIDACDAAADCYTATGLLEAANTAREKLLTSPPKGPRIPVEELIERVRLAHRMHPSATAALNFVGEFLASKLPPLADQKEPL